MNPLNIYIKNYFNTISKTDNKNKNRIVFKCTFFAVSIPSLMLKPFIYFLKLKNLFYKFSCSINY